MELRIPRGGTAHGEVLGLKVQQAAPEHLGLEARPQHPKTGLETPLSGQKTMRIKGKSHEHEMI